MNENELIYGVQTMITAALYNIASESFFEHLKEMALLSAEKEGYKVVEYLGFDKPKRSFASFQYEDGDWGINYYDLTENKGFVYLNSRMRVTK